MPFLREHHHLVLFRPAAELFPGSLREPLHQHLKRLPLVFLVLLGRDLRLERDQFVQPPDLHLLSHIVGQVLCSIRPGALRVLEHEGRVVSHLAHQRQTHLVVLLRLGVIAHEDIRRQPAVGDDPPDGSHAVQIPLAGVLPVHESQDAVAAALHGQMDMLAHVRHLGNHLQRLVAHVLRVARRKADAHVRCLFCYPS